MFLGHLSGAHAGVPKFLVSSVKINELVLTSVANYTANLQNPLCFSRYNVGFVQSYQAYRRGKLGMVPLLGHGGYVPKRERRANATCYHDTEKRATVWRKRDN